MSFINQCDNLETRGHWKLNPELIINDLRIEIYKFRPCDNKNELYFQFRENPDECEILYELYRKREIVTFEFDFDNYALYKFEGWIVKFDRVEEEFDQVSIVLHIVKFTIKEN